MKAVVWQAPGQIDLEEAPDARIEQPGDAVVRLTTSAICGTPGTSFFGGPEATGPVNGLQVGFARIPFAAADLILLPDAVPDEQAIVHLAVKMGNRPPPRNHPAAGGPGGQRRRRPSVTADSGRADRRRGQCLPHLDTREPGWVKVALAPVA
jgi:hypothetical protein